MHTQNLLAAANIGEAYRDLAVKATRTEQGLIEHVRAVGRSDDDDAFVAAKTIHFDQQLIQGLFALVVTATEACTTLATHRINFVDEDDAGRSFFSFFKHVPDPGSTHANEHFDKVRA